MIKHGLTIDEALGATQHPCTKKHLYRRVKAARDALVSAAAEGARGIISEAIEVEVENSTEVSTLTPTPPSSKKRKAYTKEVTRATLKRIQDGDEIDVKDKKTLKQMEDAIEASIVSSLLDLSSKSSKEATRKPPRRNAKQAAFHRSTMLAHKNDVEGRYKLALKEGTTLYSKGGISMQQVCIEMNEKYNLPRNRKLNRMTISNYCHPKRDLVNKSPLKRGRKGGLPLIFLELLEAHVSMCQLSGNGEMKPKKLKALIGAAIHNTCHSGSFSVEYVYKKLKEVFPNTVQESKSMKVEDRRMNWTTYPNLNLWFEGTKKELIHYGYVTDEPQVVRDIFRGHPMPFDIPGEFIFNHYDYFISDCSHYILYILLLCLLLLL